MVDLNDLFDDVGGRRVEDNVPPKLKKATVISAFALLHATLNKSDFNYLLITAKDGEQQIDLARTEEELLAVIMKSAVLKNLQEAIKAAKKSTE